MALINPTLHRHVLKKRYGYAVAYPDLDNVARWKEAMAFCQDPDTIGTFDWLVSIGPDNTGEFYFSNENTAFAFKMRFG
jgi:hypothetical protein